MPNKTTVKPKVCAHLGCDKRASFYNNDHHKLCDAHWTEDNMRRYPHAWAEFERNFAADHSPARQNPEGY